MKKKPAKKPTTNTYVKLTIDFGDGAVASSDVRLEDLVIGGYVPITVQGMNAKKLASWDAAFAGDGRFAFLRNEAGKNVAAFVCKDDGRTEFMAFDEFVDQETARATIKGAKLDRAEVERRFVSYVDLKIGRVFNLGVGGFIFSFELLP